MTYGIYSCSVTGLFGVPLAGVFAVGIFTKRTNTFGVICGLILGIIFAYVYNGVGKELTFLCIYHFIYSCFCLCLYT